MNRIVIQLDADGGNPTVTADSQVEVVFIKQGKDLVDYDDSDMFVIPDRLNKGETDLAVGHAESAHIDTDWVNQVFTAVQAR